MIRIKKDLEPLQAAKVGLLLQLRTLALNMETEAKREYEVGSDRLFSVDLNNPVEIMADVNRVINALSVGPWLNDPTRQIAYEVVHYYFGLVRRWYLTPNQVDLNGFQVLQEMMLFLFNASEVWTACGEIAEPLLRQLRLDVNQWYGGKYDIKLLKTQLDEGQRLLQQCWEANQVQGTLQS